MPFLITGCPRSGTRFMVLLLRELGYKIGSEAWHEFGTVSWRHLDRTAWFVPVLHQTREPLASIGSACTIRVQDFRSMFSVVGEPPIALMHRAEELARLRGAIPDPLNGDVEAMSRIRDPITVRAMSMWAWYMWSLLADDLCSWTYQVENVGVCYPELFGRLGLPVPAVLPEIPTDTNTRRHHANWQQVTWDGLEELDTDLTGRIRELGALYGYESV